MNNTRNKFRKKLHKMSTDQDISPFETVDCEDDVQESKDREESDKPKESEESEKDAPDNEEDNDAENEDEDNDGNDDDGDDEDVYESDQSKPEKKKDPEFESDIEQKQEQMSEKGPSRISFDIQLLRTADRGMIGIIHHQTLEESHQEIKDEEESDSDSELPEHNIVSAIHCLSAVQESLPTETMASVEIEESCQTIHDFLIKWEYSPHNQLSLLLKTMTRFPTNRKIQWYGLHCLDREFCEESSLEELEDLKNIDVLLVIQNAMNNFQDDIEIQTIACNLLDSFSQNPTVFGNDLADCFYCLLKVLRNHCYQSRKNLVLSALKAIRNILCSPHCDYPFSTCSTHFVNLLGIETVVYTLNIFECHLDIQIVGDIILQNLSDFSISNFRKIYSLKQRGGFKYIWGLIPYLIVLIFVVVFIWYLATNAGSPGSTTATANHDIL